MESHVLVLLRACSNLKQLKQVHALITKTGLADDTLVLTKLLICSALPAWGSLEHARTIFLFALESHHHDPVLHNTMVRAYSKSLFPVEAIRLYNSMCRGDVPTDHLTYPFVLRACGRAGPALASKGAETHCRVSKVGLGGDIYVQNAVMFMYGRCGRVKCARRVFDGMGDRTIASWNTMVGAYDTCGDLGGVGSLLRSMPDMNVVSWNAAVSRHVRAGNIVAAREVFESMPERDAASWNSLISGYIHVREFKCAFELFDRMMLTGVKPTEITLVSILGACSESGALEMGMRIHGYLRQIGFKTEGYVGNALLDMYAKCGNLRSAMEVFNTIQLKHVTCWNTMIVGLAVHGYPSEALEIFSLMEKESSGDSRPNQVTFLGVLLASSHKGLVKEGQNFFHRMIHEYKITPDIKHYGCMADLLSRGGLIHEAYEMIRTMPFEANSVSWRTLLGACRVHGNVLIAEEAFRKIYDLGMLNHGDYVLLSNIYADAQRWQDMERLGQRMMDCGALKQSGVSQIEVQF